MLCLGQQRLAWTCSCVCWQKGAETTTPQRCSTTSNTLHKTNQWNWTPNCSISYSVRVAHNKTRYTLCLSVDTWVTVKLYFTTWASNLKWVTYSRPAISGDLMANNQETSSLINWCTKGPLILSIWQPVCTRRPPHLLSLLLMKCWRWLSAAISIPLFVSVFAPAFDCPEFHSGRAQQMQDDPVISV